MAIEDPSSLSIAHKYWAHHLGCAADGFFAEPFRLVNHGAELADYWGVFALFRDRSVTVSCPSCCMEKVRDLLSAASYPDSPMRLATALDPLAARVIGPAYIGYASVVEAPSHPVRALFAGDSTALDTLMHSCDPTEWDHGGSSIDQSLSGLFCGGQLVAVAGYEVWGDAIAHIAVITHPDFRGQGFGRSVVAHVAERAIAAGLLAQYRTLEANVPSIRIAASLGFQPYATSVAVRLKPQVEMDGMSPF